ncbi:MAG: hypothetical protein C4583_18415 [Anaerolineaceae bacterium]|nr:MAG: hypothetical protein C4583_18415 [Anaerolineaceae bacterium]
MTKKTTSKSKSTGPARKSTPGRNLLLTLTLVPLIIGILLIGAWVLEIDIFDEPQLHVTVGILFFLLSFAISNVLQKRWMLAAGWGLLMGADIIILAWLHVWAQAAAIAVGAVGLVFLGIEFYRQYQVNRKESLKK